jgi:hypothetical protein
LTDYQFNNRTIHHRFCKTCGIQSYAYGKGPGGKDMVMLNVRCLDDIDTEQFKVKKFDGASHNGQTVVRPSQALGSIPDA